MSDWYLLVAPLLLLVVVGVFSFVGCLDYERVILSESEGIARFVLRYPPALPVSEVTFRIKTDKASLVTSDIILRMGDTENSPTYFSLFDHPDALARRVKADGAGEYSVAVVGNEDWSESWQVWCDASGEVDPGVATKFPYFDETEPLEQTVNADPQILFEEFVFAVNPATKRVEGVSPLPPPATVVLSFTYTGGDVAIVRVDFVVKLDKGNALGTPLILRAPKMVDDKTGFTNHTIPNAGVVTNDAGKNNPSRWEAKIEHAPRDNWVVSCIAYRQGAGNTEVVRFDTGKASSKTKITGGSNVTFKFIEQNGKTVSS
jgi:hypothetical protein